MRKDYIKPSVEEFVAENLMVTVNSVEMTGSVEGEKDTNWGFGGDSNETDNPTSKATSIWDDWTAEGEEEE